MNRLLVMVLCWFWLGCGTSLENSIDQLSGSEAERLEAQQMLLLAKDRSVEPLLAALADTGRGAARIYLVDALVSLMTRVNSAKILAGLLDFLRRDADAAVRARIAEKLGVFKQAGAIDGLLLALDDKEGEVRYQVLVALNALEAKLDSVQKKRLTAKLIQVQNDPYAKARYEAQFHTERQVEEWVLAAQQAELKAQLDQADSLYAEAIEFSPASKRANYRLARFYRDNGQPQKGEAILRRHGMLLDVPRLETVPQMDGLVEAGEWSGAVRSDSFFVLGMNHSVALPAEVKTHFYLGYTGGALYMGFYAHDEHPDSLVTRVKELDPSNESRRAGGSPSIHLDDIFELFIDPGFDQRGYGHIMINSLGVYGDGWWNQGGRQAANNTARDWTVAPQVATHVGADFWSLEVKLDFDEEYFPRPGSQSTWGFNVVRTFRGKQYNQWVRTYRGGHSPNDFGLLVFE